MPSRLYTIAEVRIMDQSFEDELDRLGDEVEQVLNDGTLRNDKEQRVEESADDITNTVYSSGEKVITSRSNGRRVNLRTLKEL
ncbi:MAG: hypothetical protein GY820_04635 [Gammaproteobacteria bacterium]|nr:hypothetical protein [Gammaproteobacteria bacterium]